MKTNKNFLIVLCITILFSGCVSLNEHFRRRQLESRQMETRYFETNNEKLVLQSCVQVLQDLGFVIKESDAKLGVIEGVKERKADNLNTNSSFLFTGDWIDFMDSAFSSTDDDVVECRTVRRHHHKETVCKKKVVYDVSQKIFASVVANKSNNKKGYNVRVKFARIIYNSENRERKEDIRDAKIYQEFFDKLHHSIFLTGNDI